MGMKSMKLLKALSVALLVSTASLPVAAESIAVLGVQQALLASDDAKAFRKKLKQDLAADEKKLQALEKQAKAAQDKVKKNQGLVSDQEMSKLRLQFQKVFGEYNKRGQALQQKRVQAEQAFLKKMQPKLDKVVRGLIEAKKYDVVINKQATLFARKEVDITREVVELLNKK